MMKGNKVSLIGTFFLAVTSFCYADINFPFEGQIDFTKKQLDFILKLNSENSVKGQAIKLSEKDYHFFLNVNRKDANGLDLLHNLESSVEFIDENEDGVKTVLGKVWNQYPSLENHPTRDLAGEFAIRDNRFQLNYFSFGKINCHGYVDFNYPYKMDLSLGLDAVNMDEVVSLFTDQSQTVGLVSGEIKVSGVTDRIELRGSLESFDGYLEDLKFDTFHLNFAGTYPVVEIADSSISQRDGMSFSLKGQVDLENPEDFGKQIQKLSYEPLIGGSDNKREWTIRRWKDEGSTTNEFKYFLKKDDALNSSPGSMEILGVERTVEF